MAFHALVTAHADTALGGSISWWPKNARPVALSAAVAYQRSPEAGRRSCVTTSGGVPAPAIDAHWGGSAWSSRGARDDPAGAARSDGPLLPLPLRLSCAAAVAAAVANRSSSGMFCER